MHSKVTACTDSQTDTQTGTHTDIQYENITLAHMLAVMIFTRLEPSQL